MAEILVCEQCGASFELSTELEERYPGWRPKRCRDCHTGASSRRARSVEDNLPVAEVLATYTEGPDSGVFTDGSADPNPGPGGWGAVYVVDGEIVSQDHGDEEHTTNNRMELTAIIHGLDLVPTGTTATLYTDSKLAVNTLTEWASGWKARGWKRRTGPVENLDLVKEAYEKLQGRPELSIEWIPAHRGFRWNEYADALSTAYRRDTV